MQEEVKLTQEEAIDTEEPNTEEVQAAEEEIEAKAESKERIVKVENGMEFTADAYLYVGDPEKPSTWKLRIEETPGNITRAQLGRAAAALGPGFRGNRVDLPAEDRKKCAKKLIALYRKLEVPDEEIPEYLFLMADMQVPTKAVKVVEDDKGNVYVRGYAVVFGGKDLTGDTFTKDTDFWFDKLKAVPVVLYEHGFDPAIGKEVLGKIVKINIDDVGVWVEAQLNRHKKYLEKVIDAIVGLCKKGVMGFSTGAVAHLVEREGGYIKSWPIIEVSLTVTPAEPRTLGVEAIKSLGLESLLEDQKTSGGEETMEAGYASKVEEREVHDFISYLKSVEVKLNTTTGPSGGYFVPVRLANELVTAIEEQSLFRKAGCRVIQLTTPTDIAGFDYSAEAVLTSEGGQITPADVTARKVSFRPYKFSKLTRVSVELATDSQFDLWGQVLKPDFANAFAKAENKYFTIGTGTNEPQGIKNASVGVESASANAITADEVIDFVYSLSQPYRDGAVIMAHPSFVREVAKLKDNSGQYIFLRSPEGKVPGTILGIPVYENAYLDAVGEAGGIAAVIFNPSYYYIGEIGMPEVQKLVELYAATGEIGFVAHRRFDGHIMLSDAFRAFKLKSGA